MNSAALPLGSEAANTHNTTLGTIREEKFDPGDFVIKYYASISDMIWFVWTLLMYLADIVSDIVLAAMYWSASQQLYFSLTLGFIAVPSLAMMIFSLVLYVRDYRIVGERASPIRWVSRIFFLVLQLGPLLRCVRMSTRRMYADFYGFCFCTCVLLIYFYFSMYHVNASYVYVYMHT